MKYYDKLIFELSKEGRKGYSLPRNTWGRTLEELPQSLRRSSGPCHPQESEPDDIMHYTNLSQMNFGVDSGL